MLALTQKVGVTHMNCTILVQVLSLVLLMILAYLIGRRTRQGHDKNEVTATRTRLHVELGGISIPHKTSSEKSSPQGKEPFSIPFMQTLIQFFVSRFTNRSVDRTKKRK